MCVCVDVHGRNGIKNNDDDDDNIDIMILNSLLVMKVTNKYPTLSFLW